MGLKVIVAGLTKTGNTVVCDALRTMGYTVHDTPEHITLGYELYRDLFKGEAVTVQRLREFYSNVDAVTDLPAALYWRELQVAFPEAKVVHLMRPQQEWYESVSSSYAKKDPFRWLHQRKIPWLHTVRILAYGSIKPEKRLWVDAYNNYNRALKIASNVGTARFDGRTTSVWRFRIKRGWKPLCEYLGKPVPDVDFPKLKDREYIRLDIANRVVTHNLKLFLLACIVLTLMFASDAAEAVSWLCGAIGLATFLIIVPALFKKQFDPELTSRCRREQLRQKKIRKTYLIRLKNLVRRRASSGNLVLKLEKKKKRKLVIEKKEADIDTLILQLGTVPWQRQGEFTAGSGFTQEKRHHFYNSLAREECHSIFPSKFQSSDEKIHVFRVKEIPIFTAIPCSNYRYIEMSNQEFMQYVEGLMKFTKTIIADHFDSFLEKHADREIRLIAVGHHMFVNPIVLCRINQERRQQGKQLFSIVASVHGTALKMFQSLPKENHFTKMMQDVLKDISKVIVLSDQQSALLVNVFPDIPVGSIAKLRNGINTTDFCPEKKVNKRAILKKMGVLCEMDDPYIVIFVGKFAPWKRLDTVLLAASRLKKENIVFLIVGTGVASRVDAMHSLHQTLGCESNCFFLGPRTHKELKSLYNVADVGLFPSFEEPFGNVFLECMACGTPVIGANSGGPVDFITGLTGRLISENGYSPPFEDLQLRDAFANEIMDTVLESREKAWKHVMSKDCVMHAQSFSVKAQCIGLLRGLSGGLQRELARQRHPSFMSRVPSLQKTPSYNVENSQLPW